MTQEEFKNKKWRIGQKVYVIYIDEGESGKRTFFLRMDEVSAIVTITTEKEKIIDAISTKSKLGHHCFYSDCNHHQFIFTNKKDAEKALREFKKKYENGL